MQQNKWLDKNSLIVDSIPFGCVGFVYIIHNITKDKFYVGKKLFMSKRLKSVIESDWKTYTGSNIELNTDIKSGDNINKTILHLCKSKGTMSYLEITEQIQRNALLDDRYYNKFIGCKIHYKHIK